MTIREQTRLFKKLQSLIKKQDRNCTIEYLEFRFIKALNGDMVSVACPHTDGRSFWMYPEEAAAYCVGLHRTTKELK